MPSLRLNDFPFAVTSHSRTKKSVCSSDDRTYNVAVTGPITVRSSVSGGLVYVSTSRRRSRRDCSLRPAVVMLSEGPPTEGVGSLGL